ncbi:Holliday junction branch migration protein RuvA [Brachybacterium sp. YJGR34]|uniref:Holliday junction branch migration protein RuvA n=1 Tax=Brachybacterium sp. YJGR34 TaxID=2059911 RepID=UPI000E0CAC71|nr:Holliday junction branch migration protein RuvA [Brachybacterium sp. YJGR34]
MIASLTGRVARIDLDSLVLDVGGVGYLVRTTPEALAATRHDAELTLHTELIVREDSMTLYGFPQHEEAETFRIVQSISGIGPRTALAVLAVLEPEELRRAVAEQDTKALTRTPGIGPKVAGRMLLELGGKLPAPAGGPVVPDGAAAAGPAGAVGGVTADVVEALVGLGWQEKAALGAVEEAAAEGGEALDAAELLRRALRGLGGHR